MLNDCHVFKYEWCNQRFMTGAKREYNGPNDRNNSKNKDIQE